MPQRPVRVLAARSSSPKWPGTQPQEYRGLDYRNESAPTNRLFDQRQHKQHSANAPGFPGWTPKRVQLVACYRSSEIGFSFSLSKRWGLILTLRPPTGRQLFMDGRTWGMHVVFLQRDLVSLVSRIFPQREMGWRCRSEPEEFKEYVYPYSFFLLIVLLIFLPYQYVDDI